jgi:hypothetical protein
MGIKGAWAGAAETHASSSSAWAGQPFFDGDSDADDVDPMPVEPVVGAAVVEISSIQSTIALIEPTTTIAKNNSVTKQLTQLLQESKSASEVGACALAFHNLLQKLQTMVNKTTSSKTNLRQTVSIHLLRNN